MAKRGYRGKHPHDDMKVSINNPSSTKYNSKLTTEYNNLPDKQKYSYIRSNYFYPQGTMTISGSNDLTSASEITMSTTNGTTIQLKGNDVATTASAGQFFIGTAAQTSTGLISCINALGSGLGKLTATSTGTPAEQVLVTQNEPGIDGNTTITFKNVAKGVTIAGVAANLSGSGTFKFSGG